MMSHNHAHTPIHRPDERIIVHSIDDVPAFTSECEEEDYWSTHELAADLFRAGPPDPDEEAALARARRWRASLHARR